MASEDKNRYEKWLESDESKKNLILKMEASGVPLELRTMAFFRNLGFRCTKFPYHDINETGDFSDVRVRELDIRATKVNQSSFNVRNCEVVFNILFFIECKSLANTDLIFFDEESHYLPTFPIKFTGNEFLFNTYKNYKFPAVIKKIVEVSDADKVQSNDRTRPGFYQLISACKYQYYRALQHKIQLRNLRRQFHAKFPENTREDVDNNYSLDDILKEINFFTIELGFPILVINSDMGLIRAEFDNSSGNITDFENVGHGIYPFYPEHAYKYEELLNSFWNIPIIISNYDFLEDCIKTIQEGIDTTVTEIKNTLETNPSILKRVIIEEAFKYTTW